MRHAPPPVPPADAAPFSTSFSRTRSTRRPRIESTRISRCASRTWSPSRGSRFRLAASSPATVVVCVASIFALLATGLVREVTTGLGKAPLPEGHIAIHTGTVGAIGVFLVLKAFASGGAAVTGVEAISNGVPAFKPPEWKNARSTLVIMGSTLGAMFLGISLLAVRLHTVPSDRSTVISQIAEEPERVLTLAANAGGFRAADAATLLGLAEIRPQLYPYAQRSG